MQNRLESENQNVCTQPNKIDCILDILEQKSKLLNK